MAIRMGLFALVLCALPACSGVDGEENVGSASQALVTTHSAGDFNGDGKAELAVWRPSNHNWYFSALSGSTPLPFAWGDPGDVSVPGDYDGDGKQDIAVWRPTDHTWRIVNSSTGLERLPRPLFGDPGDIPTPGDYDGDGFTDIAVWRPSARSFFVQYSHTNTNGTVGPFGTGNDTDFLPVPADYDGDHYTDFAVWHPENDHLWRIISGRTLTLLTSFAYGNAGDIAVPADYDNDGKADIAVFRPQDHDWYIFQSSTNSQLAPKPHFADPGDIPAVADYIGDGRAEIAVFRPTDHNWYILNLQTNTQLSPAPHFADPGDIVLVNVNSDQGCTAFFTSAGRSSCQDYCNTGFRGNGFCLYADANATYTSANCGCTLQ